MTDQRFTDEDRALAQGYVDSHHGITDEANAIARALAHIDRLEEQVEALEAERVDAEVVYRYRAAIGDYTGPIRKTRDEAVEDGRYAVRGRYEIEAIAVLDPAPTEQEEA